MAGRKSDFVLPTLDDLFSTQEQREEAKLARIRDIPIELIDSFPDHPFKVRDDEDMTQLVESIKERGVITPATVRPKGDGRYELVSGHRRKRACELAGMDALRCEVVELTRDEATILMVESNFQRSQILPSEKAFAYKMRLDAMSRQAGRPKKENLTPVESDFQKVRTNEVLGAEVGESREQIRRYVRLYDCAAEFTEQLPEQVKFEYVDSTYHNKITSGGTYCCFCFGTNHISNSKLERHNMQTEILPQISNNRFAIVKHCKDCEYTKTEYIAAKSVVADYYGVVDGQPHTVTISDLPEAGVSTQIRYGNSAESCTLTSAPNYTEKGQYTVYYEITYTYSGVTMTKNGVAYVWLHDEKEDTDCPCGCGAPNCDCKNPDCNGSCHNKGCGDNHNFIVLETVNPTCKTLGYTRYLCVECGKIEKRDYMNAIGHAWQSIVIRDATCEAGGKVLNICKNCGECEETTTPKGEHKYGVSVVNATCVSPGYTVKECEVCGDRHIPTFRTPSPTAMKPLPPPQTARAAAIPCICARAAAALLSPTTLTLWGIASIRVLR